MHILIAMAALPLTAAAQPSRYSASIAASRTDFADTVAIEWEQKQAFVPVTIGGRQTRFLIDTGAGMSVVFSGTPTASLCTPDGTIISHDAAGHRDTMSVMALPPARVGNTLLTGIRAVVQPPPAAKGGYDGILGFDLVVSGLSMKIDVQRRRLIITDKPRTLLPAKGDTTGAIALPYRLDYHVPYIELRPTKRLRLRTLFDTGSSQLFAWQLGALLDAADRLPLREAADSQGTTDSITILTRTQGRQAIAHQGTEAHGEVLFLHIPSMLLGKHTLADISATTTLTDTHLGAPLLEHGAVAFTNRPRRMVFTPLTGSDTTVIANRPVQIAFAPAADGRPQVSLLMPGSTPERAGFSPGDIITAIDSKPVASFAQFAAWHFLAGREYTFTLLRTDGTTHQARWVRLEAAQ